eukprot:1131453-Prorocentrum_minimum.AAC.1
MELVTDLRRLDTAREEKVPPECDTMSTTASLRSYVSSLKLKPEEAMLNSRPISASTLFALITRVRSCGGRTARIASGTTLRTAPSSRFRAAGVGRARRTPGGAKS